MFSARSLRCRCRRCGASKPFAHIASGNRRQGQGRCRWAGSNLVCTSAVARRSTRTTSGARSELSSRPPAWSGRVDSPEDAAQLRVAVLRLRPSDQNRSRLVGHSGSAVTETAPTGSRSGPSWRKARPRWIASSRTTACVVTQHMAEARYRSRTGPLICNAVRTTDVLGSVCGQPGAARYVRTAVRWALHWLEDCCAGSRSTGWSSHQSPAVYRQVPFV